MTEFNTPDIAAEEPAPRPSKLAWLPNAVSIFRLLLSPVIAALVFVGLWEDIGTPLLTWALGLFVFAAVTDWLDGFLARALNAKSELGGKLDLWGDKALVGLVLLALWLGWMNYGDYYGGWGQAFMEQPLEAVAGVVILLAVVGRDWLVTELRAKAERRGVVIAPTFLAKSKTAVLMSGIAIALAGLAFVWQPVMFAGYGLIVIGAIISVITAIDYFDAAKKMKRRRRRKSSASQS